MPIEIQIAKKVAYIYATKEGTVRIFSNTGKPGILGGLLYCPESPANLLSVKKFQMAGYQTIFHVDGSISIKGKDNVIIISNTNENIPNLKLKLNSRIGRTLANICNSKSNYNLWHKRLGYISIDKFNELKNRNMVFDSKLIEAINPQGTNWVSVTQANFESGAICRGPMAAPPTKGEKNVWGTICLSLS